MTIEDKHDLAEVEATKRLMGMDTVILRMFSKLVPVRRRGRNCRTLNHTQWDGGYSWKKKL